MKLKICFVILAVALTFSLSACGSGTGDSETSDSSNSRSSVDLAAVNEAYKEILNQYGIAPISDGAISTEYTTEDIIGDEIPELIIYDYYYQEEYSAKDIYGYDNANGETFRYIGETQLFNPQKGKDEYCVGISDDGYYATYYIYEATDNHKIQEVIKFGCGNDPFGSWGEITYTIGTEYVDAELFETEISKYMAVPALPKDAVGAGADSDYTALQFDRADYNTEVTREDLLRYPDDYIGGKVFFTQYQIAQAAQSNVYYAKSVALGDAWTDNYILIDGYNNIGEANAIVGDLISVYGVFSGTSTVNVTYSNGSQESVLIPNISADMLVINSIAPTTDDFAQALVCSLNANAKSFEQKSQYISGSTVKLICGIDALGTIKMQIVRDSTGFVTADASYTLSPDGYRPDFAWKYKGSIINPYSDYEAAQALFNDFLITKPDENTELYRLVWVTANVEGVTTGMFDPSMVVATMAIESIEPFD